MPVFINAIEPTASAQDRQDLLKTLADWPETLPALVPAGADPAAWLESVLADPQQRLFGGRFNGRLIALVLLEQKAPDCAELRALCVRKLTRGRGVGERLLTLLGEMLDREQVRLECHLPVTLPTRAWMAQYGLRSGEQPGQLVRPPRA